MQINQPRRTWLIRFILGFLACGLAFFLEWQRPVALVRLDEGIRDLTLQIMANTTPDRRVVVVDISEESLDRIGPWPWSRSQVADLVEALLGAYGARAVGLDMVFSEPRDTVGDARLAALATHAPLVLAQVFDYTPRTPPITQGTLAGSSDFALNAHTRKFIQAYGHIANHDGLSSARCVGNIGYIPDADGVLRRLPILTRYQDRDYLHFANAILRCVGILVDPLPPNSKGLWRVPYTRAESAYTVIPAADILSFHASRDLIAGSYVLIGSSSLALKDTVSTPLAPLSPGVLVHAANLSGLLDLADGKTNLPWSGRVWLTLWTLINISLALLCISRLSAWNSIFLIFGLAVAWLLQALVGVTLRAEWSVSAPLWGYFLLLTTAIPHEWWESQRNTRRLLTTFSHYVAKPVLDEILRLGIAYSLKPTLCQVSVLIADMEGYTQATTSLPLADAAILTKEFLGCLTRPVLTHRGTLDKYSGDGLTAFWGAPIPSEDHADQAVIAALDILKEIDLYNAERANLGLAPLKVRIGIESGMALVGDLGTDFRSTYTAVGDCINFASRLEEAARELPARVIIGKQANKRITKFTTIPLGSIPLRGTHTTLEIYTVPLALK